MKTIELHGVLAKRFGRFYRLDVSSASEACRAIACQVPAFARFMLESEKLGYRFAVFNGKKRNQKTNIGEHELHDSTTSSHIHIVPKVMGAGGKMGVMQLVVGAVMIGAAFVTGGASIAAWGAIHTALAAAGLGMVMGGIVSMLTPTPPLTGADEEGNRANNGFGGAITTTAQGNPVPILYGERDIGGAVLSAMLVNEDKA